MQFGKYELYAGRIFSLNIDLILGKMCYFCKNPLL